MKRTYLYQQGTRIPYECTIVNAILKNNYNAGAISSNSMYPCSVDPTATTQPDSDRVTIQLRIGGMARFRGVAVQWGL